MVTDEAVVSPGPTRPAPPRWSELRVRSAVLAHPRASIGLLARATGLHPAVVRALLRQDDRRPANPIVQGVVEYGDQRGRTIGFPTANVRIGESAAPPDGVYAGYLGVHGSVFPAAINVCRRPTIGRALRRLVEAHLLDFDGDLYDRFVVIELQERLREEQRFSSLDELAAQIWIDCVKVREALSI